MIEHPPLRVDTYHHHVTRADIAAARRNDARSRRAGEAERIADRDDPVAHARRLVRERDERAALADDMAARPAVATLTLRPLARVVWLYCSSFSSL